MFENVFPNEEETGLQLNISNYSIATTKMFCQIDCKEKLIDNIVNTEILKRRMDETDISELFD